MFSSNSFLHLKNAEIKGFSLGSGSLIIIQISKRTKHQCNDDSEKAQRSHLFAPMHIQILLVFFSFAQNV